MRFIFDFDYTLFDTFRFKEAIREAFHQHGVSYELFEQTREESKHGGKDWKPSRQFEILKSQGIVHMDSIQREFQRIVNSAEEFLYADTLPFLQKARKSGTIFLVTYGEDEFQNEKVDACPSFKKYFDKIVITQNMYKDKEAKELAGGERGIFVEDNPRALTATKKIAPNVMTARMRRPNGHYIDEPSGEGIDYEIRNLHDLKITDTRIYK